MSVPKFLWSLALFLIVVALLPGKAGLAIGILVALGAVLMSEGLPQFIQTTVGSPDAGGGS